MRVVRLEDRLALGVYAPGGAAPKYFILLGVSEGRVTAIRDYRYVPYIVDDADYG